MDADCQPKTPNLLTLQRFPGADKMIPRSRTTDFSPVIFVRPNLADSKERDDDTQAEKNDSEAEEDSQGLRGEDVKEFYEELVSSKTTLSEDVPSTSRRNNQPISSKTKQKSSKESPGAGKKRKYSAVNKGSEGHSLTECSSRTVYAFLKAAQEGDKKMIDELLEQGVPIDSVDTYGWTALLCAVKAEKVDTVKYLLTKGANTDICNSQGQSVWDVAKNCSNSHIISALQDPTDTVTKKHKEVTQEEFYCETCKMNVCDTSKAKHVTSTIHLFNRRKDPKSTIYSIPENNRGFQMMLRSGWDKEKGLGSEGQGQKFPMKTVLKRDRKGLGKDTDTKPRITHFGPNDKEAVKRPYKQSGLRVMKNSTMKKKHRVKALNREKRKERNFRLQFAMD